MAELENVTSWINPVPGKTGVSPNVSSRTILAADISASDTTGEQRPLVTNSSSFGHVALAAVIASIGGILFGYDTGIISGALLLLKKEFSLTTFDQEILVTFMLIGSFVASCFGGTIVDKFGRKQAIVFSSVLFIIGALLLSFSVNFPMLISGRFVVGLGVSISVTSECTYISEISPPERRGMLVSLNEVGITLGFLIAYLLDYAFISLENGWQYMFGLSAIPAVMQIVGIYFMPQSPHHLILNAKVTEAEELLKRIRNHVNVEEEIKAIQSAIEEEKKSNGYLALMSSENNMRGRMTVGMMLVFLQQFSGQTNVLYYAPTVFQYFGYCSDQSATLVSIGLGVVKVAATIGALLTVDRFGRRSLLLAGCFFMALSLTILGSITISNAGLKTLNYCDNPGDANLTSFQNFNDRHNYNSSELLLERVTRYPSEMYDLNESVVYIYTHVNDCENCSFADVNNSRPVSKENHETAEQISLTSKMISVVSLMVFVCAYSFSYGPVTWLVLSEIFPTTLRGRAISVATCVNWGANIIVSLTFLEMLNKMGLGETFIFYGCISIGAFIFVLLFIPETKSKSLEEISHELSKGSFRVIKCCNGRS